jgi:hypothetical protein
MQGITRRRRSERACGSCEGFDLTSTIHGVVGEDAWLFALITMETWRKKK